MPSYNDNPVGNPPGVLLSVEGLDKTGKTWAVLKTAPHPLVYINCDRDNRRAVNILRGEGRKILMSRQYLHTPDPEKDLLRADKPEMQQNAQAAYELWKPMRDEYYQALEDPKVKTVFLDSGSEGYRIMRLARFGKLIEIPQVLYSKTNFEWRAMLLNGQQSGKVVIFSHRLEGEFEKKGVGADGKPLPSVATGGLIAGGYKHTNFEVDAILRHSITRTGEFQAKLLAEGVGRPELKGAILTGDEIDYTAIVAKLTRTKREKWL